MDSNRYTGEPLRLYDLMGEFMVCCPRCQKDALVSLPIKMDYKNGRLRCRHCHFQETAINRLRFKSADNARCSDCGSHITDVIADLKSPKSKTLIKCTSCGSPNQVARWESYILKYLHEGIIDAVFGLPLFLQIPVKNEILWAYNLPHLNEIQNYVAAKLRERTTSRFKMTMVEKLPNFIKVAKNRNEIIKAIDKLRSKIVDC